MKISNITFISVINNLKFYNKSFHFTPRINYWCKLEVNFCIGITKNICNKN